MQKTHGFQEWWIALERQEVRNCLSCREYSSILGQSCFLTADREYPWSSQSLPSEKTAGVVARLRTDSDHERTLVPPRGCALHRLQSTSVGVLDLFTVSISPELNSSLLIMCTDAPESTTYSRSSCLFEVGAGITFGFKWRIERSFPEFLNL